MTDGRAAQRTDGRTARRTDEAALRTDEAALRTDEAGTGTVEGRGRPCRKMRPAGKASVRIDTIVERDGIAKRAVRVRGAARRCRRHFDGRAPT